MSFLDRSNSGGGNKSVDHGKSHYHVIRGVQVLLSVSDIFHTVSLERSSYVADARSRPYQLFGLNSVILYK